jgi:forespore regulator of the sigma-K checkpoint
MTVKIRLVFMVFLLLGAFYFTFFHEDKKEAAERTKDTEELTEVETSAHTVKVVLKRTYLDGEVSEEVVQETIWSMEDFWAQYEQWDLVDMNEERIIFQQEIDDISPLLKTNGFFGISDKGVLSIFNGKPGQSEIIQSFFQLDVKKLESKKHEELVKGIPVKSKQEYQAVIESFKPYSRDGSRLQ